MCYQPTELILGFCFIIFPILPPPPQKYGFAFASDCVKWMTAVDKTVRLRAVQFITVLITKNAEALEDQEE